MAESDVLPCNFRFSAYIAFCMFAVLNESQLKEHKFWGCSAEAAVETGCSVEATCVAMCPYKPASRGHDRNFLPGCRCVLAETKRHCMHVWDFHSHAGLEKTSNAKTWDPKLQTYVSRPNHLSASARCNQAILPLVSLLLPLSVHRKAPAMIRNS